MQSIKYFRFKLPRMFVNKGPFVTTDTQTDRKTSRENNKSSDPIRGVGVGLNTTDHEPIKTSNNKPNSNSKTFLLPDSHLLSIRLFVIKILLYAFYTSKNMNVQLSWNVTDLLGNMYIIEPVHEISNSVVCATSQAQISLCIRAVWSESSLVAWVFYDC